MLWTFFAYQSNSYKHQIVRWATDSIGSELTMLERPISRSRRRRVDLEFGHSKHHLCGPLQRQCHQFVRKIPA